MDAQTKDRIFVEGKDTPYAQAVMDLLGKVQWSVLDEFCIDKLSSEDLLRIHGKWLVVSGLINSINASENKLQADAIIKAEYPDGDGDKNKQ